MMRRNTSLTLTVIMLFAAISSGGETARAYQLPVGYMLKELAASRIAKKVERMRITARVISGSGDAESVAEAIEWVERDARWRSEMIDARGKSVFVRDGRETTWQPHTGQAVRGKSPPDPLTLVLAGARTQEELDAGLKALNIDTTKKRYDRFRGIICSVVGANPGDTTSAQLWLNKDDYTPLRYLHTRKTTDDEERYLEWDSPVTGGVAPRVIERWKDGKRVFRREIVKIEVNAPADAMLFKVN